MRTYVLSRIIQAFIMIIVAFVFSFFLFRIVPGDPTLAITGDPRLPLETKRMLYKMFGLDKPLHEQLLIFIINAFKGNLGISYQYKIPVTQLLLERLWNTLILLLPATLLSILIGIVMGMLAGWFRGKTMDTILTSLATLFWSTPSFWAGMFMIYLFAVRFHIFPTGGMMSYEVSYTDWWSSMSDFLHHLFLPMVTYAVIYSGQYALVLRNSLSEVLSEDYILLAEAKGCTEFQILRKHALKNASLPLVTMVGVNLGRLLLGSITIETVFTWPGVGRLVYEAVYYHDYPVLQGIFVFFITVTILLTVIVDILYTYLDPRVRLR
ncbi:ABC transporter permease [Candidatus Bathyarchaeota archaeon]|nr:MAG: ABC transporter permease [Candidatus Bathyarchaeota archaeon]